MNNKTRQMVYAGLLTALAIIIPIQFIFLRFTFGPFTATLVSHVPMILAMLISPFVAVVVGIGSTIGFLMAGSDPIIIARAATHIIVGYVGAKIIMKSQSYITAVTITAPIHGLLEAAIVIPFFGLNIYKILVVVAVGTILHHAVDSTIAYVTVKAVAKARHKSIYNVFGDLETQQAIKL